jgi:hypothetical protein
VAAVRRRRRLSLLGLLHRQHVARVVRSLPAWLPASLPAFARACVGFHISLSLSLSLFHRATGLWWCFCLTSTRTPPATRGGLLASSTGPSRRSRWTRCRSALGGGTWSENWCTASSAPRWVGG